MEINIQWVVIITKFYHPCSFIWHACWNKPKYVRNKFDLLFAIVNWIYSGVTFVCINNINLFWTIIESSSTFSFRQRHVIFFRNKFGSVIMSITHCRTDKKWISMRKQCGKKLFHFLSISPKKRIFMWHGQIHWYYSHRSQKKNDQASSVKIFYSKRQSFLKWVIYFTGKYFD
jgi:hypothetical protein